MSCYQWGSCLPCENLQRSLMELAMISNFHHRRAHRGIELGTFRSWPWRPWRPRIHMRFKIDLYYAFVFSIFSTCRSNIPGRNEVPDHVSGSFQRSRTASGTSYQRNRTPSGTSYQRNRTPSGSSCGRLRTPSDEKELKSFSWMMVRCIWWSCCVYSLKSHLLFAQISSLFFPCYSNFECQYLELFTLHISR